MRAAEKAKTREDTTEEHLIEREREREGGRVLWERKEKDKEKELVTMKTTACSQRRSTAWSQTPPCLSKIDRF